MGVRCRNDGRGNATARAFYSGRCRGEDRLFDPSSCPGSRDTVIPVEIARKLFERISSKDKQLRIFTPEEGGAEHCQVDAIQIITATIGDWMAEHL